MRPVVHPEVLGDLNDLETALTAVDERKLHGASGILIYLNGAQWFAAINGDPDFQHAVKNAQQQASDRLAGKELIFAPEPSSLYARGVSALKAKAYKPLRFQYQDKASPAFGKLSIGEMAALTEIAICDAIEEGLPRCIVSAPDGRHFELPSKSHASHFIRLSEAFDCIEAVQQVAYWIVASLVHGLSDDEPLPARAFLVDHPTMLLLGSHINLIYGGAHQVLTLKGYPSEATFRTEASTLLQRMSDEQIPVTAVIGIASTGKLAKILRELASASGAELEVCLAFAPLDIPEGPPPLARIEIDGYVHSADAGTCEHCAEGRARPIQVHSQSFLLSIAAAEGVPLKPVYFDLQRKFVDTYGALPGVLRIHYEDPNEIHPRHHAFGIEVAELLTNADFLDEVLNVLRALDPKPDFVVIPDHMAREQLRAALQHWSDVPVVTLKELDTLQGRIPAKPTVLVFDDKVVSGQQLRNINTALRTPRPHLWESFSHLHFFAPVITIKSKARLSELEKGLTRNPLWAAQLHYLYFIPLPEWHTAANCPWCTERKVLQQLAEDASAFDTEMSNRIAQLEPNGQLDAMACLALTPGEQDFPMLASASFAGNVGASQMQVLIATASAVQQLRTDSVKPLSPHSLTQPTKLTGFVVRDAFTEKLISYSILRSLNPEEISGEMRDHLVEDLRHRDLQEGSRAYQIEVATALLTGKMGTVKRIGNAWDALVKYGVSESSLVRLGFLKD